MRNCQNASVVDYVMVFSRFVFFGRLFAQRHVLQIRFHLYKDTEDENAN